MRSCCWSFGRLGRVEKPTLGEARADRRPDLRRTMEGTTRRRSNHQRQLMFRQATICQRNLAAGVSMLCNQGGHGHGCVEGNWRQVKGKVKEQWAS